MTITELVAQFAQHVEGLVPGAAAAIFTRDASAGVLTRVSAGPRWRTAEGDEPAWLARQGPLVAQAVHTALRLNGELMSDHRAEADGRAYEVCQVPLTVDGVWWGALVVVRPTDTDRQASDHMIVETCARHLATALTALVRRPLLGAR